MKLCLISFFLLLFCLPVFSQFHYFFSDSSTNPRAVIAARHIAKDSIFSYSLQGKKIVDSTFLGLETYNADGSIAVQAQVIGKKQFIVVDSFSYNANGLLIRQAMSGNVPEPFAVTTTKYDSRGLDTGSISYSKDSRGARTSIASKEYNSAGKLIKKYLQWDGEEKYLAEEWKYDNEGRLSEVTEYNKTGAVWYVSLYEYSTEKRRMTIYRKKQGGPVRDRVFEYNAEGRCTHISWYFGKDTYEYSFLYNPDGTLSEYRLERKDKKEIHRHYYSKGN